MCTKRLGLALLVILGFVGSQASGAFFAAYWDENYATHWSDLSITIEIRDYFEAAGYEILDADQLKDWMDDRIADQASSVVIICPDVAPETVIETNTADCTLRQYLDAGGKVVFHGDIPFYNQGNPGGGETNWGGGGSQGILGFNAAGATWDTGNTVTLTTEGQEWGLTETWGSLRPANPADVDIILATDDAGNAAAWVKHYVEDDTSHGFVRLFDRNDSPGDQPNLEDMQRVAEYGMGPDPLARGPKPRNGSMISQTTALLEWLAGDYASVHNLYFGESFEAVDAATPDDADLFVGTLSSTLLPIGAGGDLYPDGLVPGQTYYWRVDEVNDLNAESPWKGDVWSFTVQPLVAFNPTPADGTPFVLPDVNLTWEGGMGALFHTVFFGETFEEVDAMAGGWMTADPTIDPGRDQLHGPLQTDSTYYWRVDEFSMTGMTYKGEVWSFSTVPEIAVEDPTLVGWWTFDEGVGISAVDWSGNGNHGVMVGDIERTDGYHGDALAFDGSSYVNCGTGATLNIRDEITIACWIKIASFTRTWEAILAKGDDSYRLSRGPGDGDSIHFGCNGPTGGNLNGATVVTDNKWHHVALVYDGTNKINYIDGVEDARLASTGQINESSYELYIGANSQQAGRFLEGLVDDVRIYNRALSEEDLQAVMRGDPLLAGDPEPGRGAVVNTREATSLRWSAGDTAASHDVYFGTDRAAVEGDTSSPAFQGNQTGTTFSLAGLVEFGGGDYFWRIDEVESDGTVQAGYVWTFTIPDFLIVEDFESYTDDEGERIYETWIDGWTNGTGSVVGNLEAPFAEQTIVRSGGQSMPLTYDNSAAPGISEGDRTFSPAQDWTADGVTTLVVHFRGATGNTGQLYATINGTKIPYPGAADDIASIRWIPWEIDLAAAGVNAANVTTLTIGVEGGSGILYVDDIRLTKP